jgi:hypothetical protein
MMINCKESAIRSSELRDQHIKGIRKFELWFHIAICKFCRIYHKQINMLGKFARMMGAAGDDETIENKCFCDQHLSEEARNRIKQAMSDN